MTELRIAVVDVFVLRRVDDGWHVLVLRRGVNTRCTGAWEIVHGRIEPGERPEAAAIREVTEETGLPVERLYHVAVHPFYLHTLGTVVMAVGFAAVVAQPGELRLGPEHDRGEWLPFQDATRRLVWPRSRTGLADVAVLLRGGDAGPVEDVLRVL